MPKEDKPEKNSSPRVIAMQQQPQRQQPYTMMAQQRHGSGRNTMHTSASSDHDKSAA